MIIIDDYKKILSDAAPELIDLKDAVSYSELDMEIEKLEAGTQDQAFWEDKDNQIKVFTAIKILKDKKQAIDDIVCAISDIATMIELYEEEQDEELEKEITTSTDLLKGQLDAMKLSTLLVGEYDGKNAIITLHAGAGGTESQDWAEMLYRMYSKYCTKKGFKTKTLDYLAGDEAGIKSISFSVEGRNAYGFLKCENGIHRLVRISPFDSSGRRHTSFASCEVMPEIEDAADFEIRTEDLRIDTYRSGGAGGQHVNKTDSAVRITHIPTGIVTACQNERSQLQNKSVAMKMLVSKLAQIKEQEHLERIEDIKGNQKEITWGSQIRSYVFMPYTMVKDHRTAYEDARVDAVMDGEIQGFLNAYLKALSKNELLK